MTAEIRRTIIDSEKSLKQLMAACESVKGSRLIVLLRPGDNTTGSNGKCVYNKGVSGRFDISAYRDRKVIQDLPKAEACKMRKNTYFVEYQIGREGYFKFFETLDELRSQSS